MSILTVQNLVKEFGGVAALDGITIELNEGEIVGLIGPNGAGKTTLFNCINGFIKPDKGTIQLGDADITNWSPDSTNEAGIGRTFQIPRAMQGLTVEESVMVGSFASTDNRRVARNESHKLMKVVNLFDKRDMDSAELGAPDQKRVELARAIATKPKVLLLDELAAGLNPQETKEMIELLQKIHQKFNLTLFLVEHIMKFVMDISKRVIAIDSGRKIAGGKPEEVAEDDKVIKSYLGERYAKKHVGSR